jgi:uncharacterized protein
VLPAELARHDGLAYALWLPDRAPLRGGVVILHGAGSSKESHYDYARTLLAVGFASISFDQRGHGESDGPMDGRAFSDVVSIAALLRERAGDPNLKLALRGSSMGGFLALGAARDTRANAVVAICPASAGALRRAISRDGLHFDVDVKSLDPLLASHEDLHATVDALQMPVVLLHAEGDEVVPVEQSRELERYLHHPSSRLIVVPGGHHRSIQHDDELQAVTVRFLERAISA